MPFPDHLDLRDTNERVDGRAVFEVIDGFWWQSSKSPDVKLRVIVPHGTKTDFASIPRFAWWIVGPPSGEYKWAAVIHDLLYRRQVTSRFLAVSLMRELMSELKVACWKRLVIYYTLRLFGGYAYKQDQAEL